MAQIAYALLGSAILILIADELLGSAILIPNHLELHSSDRLEQHGSAIHSIGITLSTLASHKHASLAHPQRTLTHMSTNMPSALQDLHQHCILAFTSAFALWQQVMIFGASVGKVTHANSNTAFSPTVVGVSCQP